ncbi:hypothetical protein BH09PSE5_BH09PSE5_27320 [soil metagenome]
MSSIFSRLLGVAPKAGSHGSNSGYRRRSGQWSYDGQPIRPADERSFTPLNRHFAHDFQQAYFRGQPVPGSDGFTFEVLSSYEARDKHHVWYCDTYRKANEYWACRYARIAEIVGADAATYRVLDHGYARDSRSAYEHGVAFPVRDVATFEPLTARYARDSQCGYFYHLEIAGSHGPSFRVIDEHDSDYSCDRARAYHGRIEANTPMHDPHPAVRTLRGADLGPLRVLGRGYAADHAHVWFEGLLLGGADAGTFEINEDQSDDIDASDRQYAWSRGRIAVVKRTPSTATASNFCRTQAVT